MPKLLRAATTARRWPRFPGFSLPCSVGCRIAAGFGLLILILAVVVAGSTWLAREHAAVVDELQAHSIDASLIREARMDGAYALILVQLYVSTGDESFLASSGSAAARASDALAEGRAREAAQGEEEDVAKLDEISLNAADITDVWQRAVVLRKSGDVQGAMAALNATIPRLQQLGAAFDAVDQSEAERAAALQRRANTTADAALWLLLISGVAGIALGVAASFVVARSILRPLSALESAALAVAGGDLQTRAPAAGPRELARLGAAVNTMTDSLVEANRRLEQKVHERTKELRRNEERYRNLVERARDVIYTLSPDGTVTSLNPAFEAITGWSRGEWLGKPFGPLIHPDDSPTAAQNHRRLLRGEAPPVSQVRVLSKSGRYLVGEFAERPLMKNGDVIGIIGIGRDITARVRGEEALRESEERFRTLAESAPLGIIVTTADGTISIANAAAESMFGYNKGELPGQPIEMLMPERFQQAHSGQCASYLSEPQTRPMSHGLDVVGRRQDGSEFPASCALGFVQTKDGPLAISFVHDVTGRKRAEQGLRALNQELEVERQQIEKLNRSLEAKVRQRTAELRRANQELRRRNHELVDARAQAATDGLTGLANHRAFQEKIREEVGRAQADGASIGLIMLDIDGFKQFNDRQGHLAGDQTLRDLARTVSDLAGQQQAYRYGGDEFAVLLPGADRRTTARAAERLRRAVERSTDHSGRRLTVSLGVASFPDTAESAEELMYGADAAMYWAKSAGKNRVGHWSKLVRQRAQGTVPWYAADGAVKAPEVVTALIAALAAKDPATRAHTERCSWYSARLAEELGLDERETSIVRLSSLLHDVGKLAVPDEVLFKPGPLTEAEWGHMRQHPVTALNILGQVRSIADATPAILHHHEHFDGSGYPDGLAGDQIPVASRILLVTDAFDAMTTDRPYREALPIETAVEELKRNSGSQFDPVIVAAFLRVLARQGARPLCQMAAAQGNGAAVAGGKAPRSTMAAGL
ncbi:MAG: PAS domain S-box protein [Chloroflexi bacterium]|nr:PAS domain S-box protein [Chloroflexota bacterium]